VLGTLT